MKKLLNLALCSAIFFCANTVMATQSLVKGNRLPYGEVNKHVIAQSTVESVNINERTKQPQEAETGGHFRLKKSQYAMINNRMLIGEKNNDNNFKLQHYAKLDIQENAELTVFENCKLKIQIDGKLNNRGKLILQPGAELISPLIDMEKDFKKTRKGKKILKHGIDNEGGIITVDKTSKIYWEEIENSSIKKAATIHKGTIDFSNLFTGEQVEYSSKDNFIVKLEGVTIKLFDAKNNNVSDDVLKKIETFKNTELGNGCVLDGEFDFNSAKSSVIKLKNDLKKLNLLKSTVVRKKGKDSKFSEDTLRGMFKNSGNKLQINCKPSTVGEDINYSLKDLLNEFNKQKEETILNTDYMSRINNSKNYIKELTCDWSETIDKGLLPLLYNQFTEKDGWKNYDIHFRFDGNKSVSFELQGEDEGNIDIANYQLSLYGDFSKYNALLNSDLLNNNNLINNFVQMYNGASPYLKTNEYTRYVVLSENGTILRLAKNLSKNDEENTSFEYAILNYLQIGTQNGSSSLEFDYTYDETKVANYAQNIGVKMLKMCNKDSTLTIKAGQRIVLGATEESEMVTPEDDEFEAEYEDLDENNMEQNEDVNDENGEDMSHGGGHTSEKPCNGSSQNWKPGCCNKTKGNKSDSSNKKVVLKNKKEILNTKNYRITEKVEVSSEIEDSESDVIAQQQYNDITESKKEQPKISNTKNAKTNVIEIRTDVPAQKNNEMADNFDDDDDDE